MGINFPSSPSAGQKFTSGKTLYTFTNGAWRTTPLDTALPFNYFINPAMQVSQQNGNASSTAVSSLNFYPADQWWALAIASPGTILAQRIQSVTPVGSNYRIRFAVVTPKASLAINNVAQLICNIEGNRVANFLYGMASAKQAIITFGFRGPAGTYSLSIQNAITNRSYVANFTITAGQTYTDTTQIFVVPGDVTGTWDTTTNVGMRIGITFAAGTQYHGVLGWQASSPQATSAITNGLATAGNSFDLSDFGLYLDPNLTGRAPPWEYPSDRQAMFDCQRYWQKCMGAVGIAINNATSPQRATYPNQAPMRIAPGSSLVGAMRAWDQATSPTISGFSSPLSNTLVNEFNFSSGAQTLGRGAMVIDTSPTIYISQNARM